MSEANEISEREAGLRRAAALICSYCERDPEGPMENERAVLVHRTFSGNGLASDHRCLAELIWVDIMDQAGGRDGD